MNDEPKKTVLGWSGQDPQYEALKAQFKDKYNKDVQPRAARGSQQPFQHDAATDYGKTTQFSPQEVRQLEQLYDNQVAQYQQQQAYDAAAYQYAQQQEQYAQQMAYAEQQAQYAQQMAYAQQQGYAQQMAYAQQQHQEYQQQQQASHDAAAYQHAQQASHDAAAYQQYYAQAQYAQQQHAPQPAQQPAQPNALGTMAAKLQARAEKQKQKLEKALAKEAKGKAERGIAGADATVGQSARRRFIKKTYTHLFFAIVAFAALLFVFRTVEPFPTLLQPFVDFALGGRWNWGVVLAAYVGVSFVCDRWASNAKSRKMQYLGLGFYVIAEAVIFVPLLAVVAWKTQDIVARGGGDPNIVRDAAFMTLGTFGFLTLSVLVSKKDFSFLRSGLFAASGAAMTLIVLSLMFGFNLGLVFSIGMVVLASGYILMQTSQILAHYDPESHVAASLALFSSIALMFWYMIRIVMRARD